jgi:iron complex transport system substrate-binding protein
MKNKISRTTPIVLVLVILLAFTLAAGCAQQQAAEKVPAEGEGPGRYPLTITDSAGETITLEKPVERIVVLGGGKLEAIRALGAAEKVVGVAESIKRDTIKFPELSQKQSVGKWKAYDIETILYLKPDIVFVWVTFITPEEIRQNELEAAGIKVVRLDFHRPGTFREEVLILGRILDRDKEAAAYAAWHDQHVNLIKERLAAIPEAERTRVFAEWGAGKKFGRRAVTGGGMHEVITLAGGINIAHGLADRVVDVETEWILTENPEVIIRRQHGGVGGYATSDPARMRSHYDAILELPGFAERVAAVKNNRTHIIDDDVVSGLVYPAGVAYMAKWFYPEIFADLDPQAIHQEFLNKFWPGLGFDIATQGVFVYPPQKQSQCTCCPPGN